MFEQKKDSEKGDGKEEEPGSEKPWRGAACVRRLADSRLLFRVLEFGPESNPLLFMFIISFIILRRLGTLGTADYL
jgi:hypothetical protein